MYKNVIFDIGGVMVDFNPKDFLLERFCNSVTEEKVYNLTFGSETWKKLDAGLCTRYEGNQAMLEAAKAEHCVFEVQEVLENWVTILRLRRRMVELVRRLKNHGYCVYYLSNIPEDTLDFLMKQGLEGVFDGGVASCEAGITKPDRRIYRKLLDDYHLKPSECVFTDDVKINAAAASDVGVLGVHFRNARVFARSLAAHGVTLNRKHPGKKPPEAPTPESAPSAEKQE